MEKIQGIYEIKNTVNGKVYIGSSNDILKRWNEHSAKLNKNYHSNQHLQNSWNKHGEKSFSFGVLENVLERYELLLREQWFFDNIVRWDFDFNIADVAGRPPSHSGERHGMFGRTGSKHKNWGKKNPEQSKRVSGQGNPMFGMSGEKSPVWGKRRPEHSERMRGEGQPCSKLTNEDVLEIRRIYPEIKSQRKVAKMFGVSQLTISHVVNRKTWRHI